MRFAFAVGLVAAFALGSVGAFLALDWPPLLREMVFGYLVVFLVIRVAIVVGHFLLAPHHERFRIIPMDTVAARFWCRRLAAFVGLFAFGWVEFGLLSTLGFSLAGRQLVAYVLGLGLLAIALETVWRRPVAPATSAEAAKRQSPERIISDAGAQNALLSIGIVLLWVLWVAPRDGELLARSGRHHPAARDRRDPARGRASTSTARFAAGRRGPAERHRDLPRARHPGAADHRRGRGARLGLGYRPRSPRRRGGHAVRPPRRTAC